MVYILFLSTMCLILGIAGVASNPSPFYGAVGLVVAAASGASILVMLGGSFLAVVLFLIYLGGMLVVFAYSVALSAEPYPETWGDPFVLYRVWGCVVLVFVFFWGFGGLTGLEGWGLEVAGGKWESPPMDFSGVVRLYLDGGCLLFFCGWVLILALFVVLELTRGLSRGSLRAI
uniref:NADH-ubiquinone oxidoreductase chain 6 n=1 Tax=Teratoscincus keyserlingii TaxID=293957 RepID=Q50ET0_9SAUR|nr:NADH dehydrogenase subunit 6 [Teratoscincus keyserlingii]